MQRPPSPLTGHFRSSAPRRGRNALGTSAPCGPCCGTWPAPRLANGGCLSRRPCLCGMRCFCCCFRGLLFPDSLGLKLQFSLQQLFPVFDEEFFHVSCTRKAIFDGEFFHVSCTRKVFKRFHFLCGLLFNPSKGVSPSNLLWFIQSFCLLVPFFEERLNSGG